MKHHLHQKDLLNSKLNLGMNTNRHRDETFTTHEFVGIDKALQTIQGELVNNA